MRCALGDALGGLDADHAAADDGDAGTLRDKLRPAQHVPGLDHRDVGIDRKGRLARRGAGRDDDRVRRVGADALDGRLDAGADRHAELLQRRDPIGPHARDVFLVRRREREVDLSAGLRVRAPTPRPDGRSPRIRARLPVRRRRRR